MYKNRGRVLMKKGLLLVSPSPQYCTAFYVFTNTFRDPSEHRIGLVRKILSADFLAPSQSDAKGATRDGQRANVSSNRDTAEAQDCFRDRMERLGKLALWGQWRGGFYCSVVQKIEVDRLKRILSKGCHET